ncbi:MAG: ABC transporter permease subunit, partial [Myxococcales bacterium]|nr:ABC transporter permease subunit [Myxococcales bacterium]
HRAGSARSRAATEAVEEALAEHRTDLRTKAAERLGVPLYTLRSEATDDPSRQLMWFLALLIGMLAPATLVISATYPTIELFVVERDKGTLETLMTSAVDRVKLVGARMIVAAGLAWVASMANVLALGLTLWHGAYLVVERLQDVPFVLSPSFLAVPPVLAGGALVTTTVLAVLFSVARTFREAQMIFSAAAFVLLAPSMVSVFACMEDFSRDLAPWPLFHTSTLAFDALRGQLVATDLLVGLATDGLAVAVLLGGWHVVFGLDRLVTGIGRPAWVDRLTGET